MNIQTKINDQEININWDFIQNLGWRYTVKIDNKISEQTSYKPKQKSHVRKKTTLSLLISITNGLTGETKNRFSKFKKVVASC